MTILLLRGFGCDARVFEPLDLDNHKVEEVEYHKVLSDQTESVKCLARALSKHLEANHYDGIIAHSMGGLIGAIMLEKGYVDAQFFIAIETAFVPQKAPYRTMFHPNTSNEIQENIKAMLKTEIPVYPDALRTSLKRAFNYELSLRSTPCPVYVLYGARTMKEKEVRIDNLDLSEATLKHVKIDFIDFAAHFPFLENPIATNRKIQTIFNHYESMN